MSVCLLVAVSSGAFEDGGAQASAGATHAGIAVLSTHPAFVDVAETAARSTGAGVPGTSRCTSVKGPGGYINPLIDAKVRSERIDQGVDYAGSGTLVAIGAGRIAYVGTSDTGWPGAFIDYQLLDGPAAGCFVFYAEGVVPAQGLRAGDTVGAGQPIATIIPQYPTGIELGWGAGKGTTTYAAKSGGWTPTDDEDNHATDAGKSFSALISSLGGPPGKVEG